TLVHYPAAWSRLLTIFVAMMFIGVMILGWTRRRLTLRGSLFGFLLVTTAMMASAIIVWLLWVIISRLDRDKIFLLLGDSRSSNLYLISFVATTIAMTSLLYNWFAKKLGVPDQTLGGLIWWLIAMLATTVYLPGGAYMFTWP